MPWDRYLREVCKNKTMIWMWINLESLYMTKSLAYMLCMKQQLYLFQIVENKSIVEKFIDEDYIHVAISSGENSCKSFVH